jgi:hypothetical protein
MLLLSNPYARTSDSKMIVYADTSLQVMQELNKMKKIMTYDKLKKCFGAVKSIQNLFIPKFFFFSLPIRSQKKSTEYQDSRKSDCDNDFTRRNVKY